MMEREEVLDRLQNGTRGLQISSDSRSEHVEAMEELLSSFKEANTPATIRRSIPRVPLRNAAILLVAFWFGIAIAAYSDQVPGDSFYRAKLAAEQPAQIVDRDLVASNRLGELEALIVNGAEPRTVLDARSDAIHALMEGQSNETMERALSLLAWPGGLDGRGVDADATNGGLLIAESDWFNQRGYTASLADGHLVTISALSGQVIIGTTGDWTVRTTGTGWQLANDGLNQLYVIEQEGRDLWVSSTARGPSPNLEQALTPPGRPETTEPTESVGVLTPVGPEGTTADAADSSESAAGIPLPPVTSRTGATSPTTSKADNATSTAPEADGVAATAPPRATTPTSGPTTTTPEPTPTQPSSAPPTSSQTTRPPTSAATSSVASTTTTVAVTTTAAQTTTTSPAVVAWNFYLQNPGSGNTSSSRNLPLSIGGAPGGSLSNFDTNRDDAPGLLIQKDGGGLSVSDSTKSQEWTWTSGSSNTLRGNAELTIWLASKDFKSGERIGLLASLQVCNSGCSSIGTAQWTGPSSGGFQRATISFGSVNQQITSGSTLRLKVVVPDGLATTDVWFAYDSGAHPSRVTID